MNRFKKFVELKSERRRLLIEAFLLAGAIQVALSFISLPVLRKLLERRRKPGASSHSVQDIFWASAVAARYIPKAACLAESLTAQYLLAQNGHSSELRIGVRRDGERLEAHAWVEMGEHGKACISEPSYTVLPL